MLLRYNTLMRYLPPFEEKIRHQTRDEMARKPLITVMGIKERLEKHFGRGFDYTYIRKLTGKVRNEISYEIDSAKIEPRLAFTRENYRMTREALFQNCLLERRRPNVRGRSRAIRSRRRRTLSCSTLPSLAPKLQPACTGSRSTS